MSVNRKIVLACSTEKELLESFNKIKTWPDLDQAQIHIVHSFRVQYYMNEFSPYVYPNDDQKEEIEKAVVSLLNSFKQDLELKDENTEVHCLFGPNPKKEITEYLKKVNADVVVVSTRGKHGIEGLFTSSFAEYMIKFSPCDVVVLRPHN